MDRLLDNSLVHALDDDAEPRYAMLETIREFGLKQLTAMGDDEPTRRRHAGYFLDLAERLTPEIDVLESLEQRAQLIAEYDNLRLALRWFGLNDEGDSLLRLTALLAGEWLARGLLREGLEQIGPVLQRTHHIASATRVQLLHAAGVMALYQGNLGRAAPFFAESLAVAQTLGDAFLIGQSLAFSGWLSYRSSGYRRADEQLAKARHLLQNIADPVRATLVLIVSGDNALVQERFGQARLHYEQTTALLRAGRYAWILADAQSGLAGAHYCLANIRQAAILYAESLRRIDPQNVTVQLVSAPIGHAAVAAATGRPGDGAQLRGAAEGFVESSDARIFPRDYPVRRRALDALTHALGERQLSSQIAAGRSLTLDQVHAAAQGIMAGMNDLAADASSNAPMPP